MTLLRLGLWLLRRERSSGEWRVLLLALIIGVGSVSTTGFLGDRIKRAMSEQGAGFLGADLLVTSPRPIDSWPAHSLQTSAALEFASMVSRDEAFQLATLRAVDAAYPLRGEVRIADRPFEAGAARPAQPPPGAVYVDQELLTLLNADVGDAVRIGEATFSIAGVVVAEPGQLGGVFGFAPRVFLRADAVEATRVLQPGSRLTYLYQFAGEPEPLAAFGAALKPTLETTQRLIGSRDGVETLRGAFANADRYLQLTALISLLLSVAAIAIAAHRHALRHYDQAALLRCMGATTAQLRTLYAVQLLTLGLLGSLAGVAIGALMQQALAGLILPDAVTRLPSLGAAPVGVAVLSGLLALAGASLPALMRLIRVPPLRVLRRDLPPLPVAAWLSVTVSGSALLILIAWYAGDARLVAGFVGALAARGVVVGGGPRGAGVVGRGGATFPSHVKLSPPAEKPIDTLLVNGVECEPYLTADHRLMLEEPERLLAGIAIVQRILQVKRVVIGIEANKPDAIALLSARCAGTGVEVAALAVKYPQGSEKQLIQALTGREVPSGGLPLEVGVVVHNVATLAAIADAVIAGQPLIERICTVTGPAVMTPKNLRIRIGTPLSHLVAACGGLREAPGKIILGGPMMGQAQLSLEVPATRGSSGVLLLRPEDLALTPEGPCIRCGRCVQACPIHLQPTTLAACARLERFETAEQRHALDCIECGSCSCICPAHLPLVQTIRHAKAAILARRRR
jgi:RnfABCDGE-type electron transport complex C subunit